MPRLKIAGNIFSDLANTAGGLVGGERAQAHQNLEESREQAADVRAQEQLDIMKREAEGNAAFRAAQTGALQTQQNERLNSEPALRQQLMSLSRQLGHPMDESLVNGMGFEAINSELQRLEREKDVQLAHSLQMGQRLQALRVQQVRAFGQFQVAARQLSNQLDAMKGDKLMQAKVAALGGGNDVNSPQWNKTALLALQQDPRLGYLYKSYYVAAQQAKGARDALLIEGGNVPSMDNRSVTSQLPFDLLDPSEQQDRLSQIGNWIQHGQMVDPKQMAITNTPVPGAPPAGAPAPAAATPGQPYRSFWDAYKNGDIGGAFGSLFNGPGDPLSAMGQPTGGFVPPGATGGVVPSPSAGVESGASSTNPAPSYPMLTVGPPPINAGVQAGSSTLPPAQPMPPAPAMPAPDRNASLFSAPPASPGMAPQPQSAPLFKPTPTPSSPDLFGGFPAGIGSSTPPSLQPQPSGVAGAAPNMSPFGSLGQLSKLRAAASAPEAEQIARQLLDSGMNYDMVTSSIPQPFQGLVAAKLPKRIGTAPLFQ